MHFFSIFDTISLEIEEFLPRHFPVYLQYFEMPDDKVDKFSSFQVQPPEEFSFRADKWQEWIARFERFRQVSELSLKPDVYQVNVLLYMLGSKAEELVKSLALSDDDMKSFSTVRDKIEKFYQPKENIIFSRAKFNARYQQPNEPIESFISSLNALADKCKYGTLKSELVRDRLVVAMTNKRLSEKMQLMSDLTLETAVNMAVQAEAVSKQQRILQSNSGPKVSSELNFVPKGKYKKKSSGKKKSDANSDQEVLKNPCQKCNNKVHFIRGKCPADGKTCRRCNGVNHFPIKPNFPLCKQVKETPKNSLGFLGVVKTAKSEPWKVQVKVNDSTILFCADTGAACSCCPETMYKSEMGQIIPCNESISGPDGSDLQIKGYIDAEFSFRDKSVRSKLYIIRGLLRPLLGKPELVPLQIVKFLGNLEPKLKNDLSVNLKQKFPEIFEGIGLMPGSYTIKLKPGAEPFAIHAPRRVPLPLLPKVKYELDSMLKDGIIESVSEASEWCHPIVVVPKVNSDRVRITTDLTALNKSVIRELWQMPGVDYTLANIGKSSHYSKIDLNSGYFQVKLDDNSKELTTFLTPFGRFRYLRIPQGLSSSPEVFSKKVAHILSGLEGVVSLIDDVLIHGPDEETHNRRLLAVLQRLKENNITLKFEKCEFNVAKIKFLGLVLSSEGVHADPDKAIT